MEAAGKRWITYKSKSDEFRIWALGDLHLMTKACAIDRLRRDIQTIKNDPFSYWIGLGDYAEWIGKFDSKRWQSANVDPRVLTENIDDLGQVTKDWIVNELMPIHDKCLGMLYGNHEDSYMKHTEQSGLFNRICQKLAGEMESQQKSQLNLGYSCLFDIVFCHAPRSKPGLNWISPPPTGTRFQRRIYCHHGKSGLPHTTLAKAMAYFDADIYFMAHIHTAGKIDPNRVGANSACTRLVESSPVGLITGSYYKTYAQGITTYSERAQYKPSKLGAVSVYIKPFHKVIRTEDIIKVGR